MTQNNNTSRVRHNSSKTQLTGQFYYTTTAVTQILINYSHCFCDISFYLVINVYVYITYNFDINSSN